MEIISLTEILNAIKADTGTKTIPLAHLCVEPNLKRRAGFWLFSQKTPFFRQKTPYKNKEKPGL